MNGDAEWSNHSLDCDRSMKTFYCQINMHLAWEGRLVFIAESLPIVFLNKAFLFANILLYADMSATFR